MKRFLSIAGMMVFVLQVPNAHAQGEGEAVRDKIYAAGLAAEIAVRASLQPVPTQDTILLNQQRTIAYAAGKAAGSAAYAPFADPIIKAYENNNPGQVAALSAIALPTSAIAATNAACLTVATNPEACAMLTQLYMQRFK